LKQGTNDREDPDGDLEDAQGGASVESWQDRENIVLVFFEKEEKNKSKN